MTPPFTVSAARPAEWAAACRGLFARRPAAAAARAAEMLGTGQVDPAGLFVARGAAGGVCGAALVQLLPGAAGLAWPPWGESTDAAGAATAAACGWLRAGGAKVCQAFTDADDRDGVPALERHGFRFATHLAFFRRDADPARDTTTSGTPLTFAPAVGADAAPFRDTLLATYEGTLDCPELNGTLTPAEVLDGLRGDGPPGESGGWFLARTAAGEPVGVVLLDGRESPAELTYLGLVPAARGKGFGDALVRFAVGRAGAFGADSLSVCVDVRNEPALGLYRRHGFRAVDLRDVYLAAWPA